MEIVYMTEGNQTYPIIIVSERDIRTDSSIIIHFHQVKHFLFQEKEEEGKKTWLSRKIRGQFVELSIHVHKCAIKLQKEYDLPKLPCNYRQGVRLKLLKEILLQTNNEVVKERLDELQSSISLLGARADYELSGTESMSDSENVLDRMNSRSVSMSSSSEGEEDYCESALRVSEWYERKVASKIKKIHDEFNDKNKSGKIDIKRYLKKQRIALAKIKLERMQEIRSIVEAAKADMYFSQEKEITSDMEAEDIKTQSIASVNTDCDSDYNCLELRDFIE